ncbi:MAG: glycosyltransferase family 2 protein [Candidatus Omnitrophica bacterium]|nr:glycosyltransferase family 2 protein [Candidatus Omnitrophota bacterium]
MTVFLPNRNHAAYVGRALEAILSQSRQPDEIVVVDDASTDNSCEVIEPYLKRHPRMRLIRRENCLGTIRNFEAVLAECRTDYLYGAAADDYVLEGFLERAMAQASAHPEAGMIFGKINVQSVDGVPLGTSEVGRWKTSGFFSPERYFEDFLEQESPFRAFGSTAIYRTEVLRHLGIARFGELGHWYDGFLGRVIGLKYGVVYLAEPSAVWTVQPGGMSQSVMTDPARCEEIILKTEAFMRSAEFHDLFPQSHVEKWASTYRRVIRWYSFPFVAKAFAVSRSWMRYAWFRKMMGAAEHVLRLCFMKPGKTGAYS